MYKNPNGKIIYPEDIQCVHDPVNGKGGIWIGNLQAAQNIQTLKRHGIKAVLTAAKGIFLNHPKTDITYQLYIPGQDHERFDISKFFNQSISFIRDALDKTNILVHCLAGVSRSVSLVMAYFIKYKNMSYDSVYAKLKSRRKIIHPNDGFISQLRKFEIQCRQNGQIFEKNNSFEKRSSYSPFKLYQRRDSGEYSPSPKKFYEYPEKKYTRNPDKFKYTDFDRNQRLNSFSPFRGVRNPEHYKSITQDIRKQKIFKYQNSVQPLSPDRYQRQTRIKTSLSVNRIPPMNIESIRPGQNIKRNQFVDKYQGYEQRNLMNSDYRPLDSIQNRPSQTSQIDRKIAQIRKKYQQYTKPSFLSQSRPLDHNPPISLYPSSNENLNSGHLTQIKINNPFDNKKQYRLNSGNKVGTRLKKLQSYQY